MKDTVYIKFCTRTQDRTWVRINWRTDTSAQEQTCVCMNTGCTRRNEHRRVFFDLFKFFSIKTQPKHVPTPPKVSCFLLNPSHSKTQAFTSLKTYQNGRSKEKWENEKSLKNLLIRSLHSPKGVVVICRSREEPSSALPLHSNWWDGKHRWRGRKNPS